MARNQSQPKYRIVEDYLRSRIKSGEFPVNGLLPTEEMLCTRFGVSRATVRTALANIQSDGLIVRSPSIGSRVVSADEHKAFQAGWKSVEDLLQHTKAVRLHVKSIEEIVLDEETATKIGFGPGRSVVRVGGVRWNQSETAAPICLVEIFFDALYNGIVDQIGSKSVPIADLIEDRYHVRIETIRQEISATVIPKDAAETLRAVEDSPALVIERWYSDANSRMFQMTRTLYPADRFRYVVEFGRAHSV
ncbi:GntR family transcriptional regulator [Pelagibius marinus]|uniref:GntR family transcriptional regulator n=1 Tax=Pelagibius marinus TaxID=2762760 RepID=UPI001872DCF4|nr:GntR family transcriptional regulator [Pelagibius marinus]